MTNGFSTGKIDFIGDISGHISTGVSNIGMPAMRNINSLDATEPASFKSMLTGLAQNLNGDLNAPDKLLKSAMSGDSDVDIHDVMTAMSKAEIDINVATQITSKVIQAYDKIMQISV